MASENRDVTTASSIDPPANPGTSNSGNPPMELATAIESSHQLSTSPMLTDLLPSAIEIIGDVTHRNSCDQESTGKDALGQPIYRDPSNFLPPSPDYSPSLMNLLACDNRSSRKASRHTLPARLKVLMN